MKIDICERVYTTRELCNEVQYCCILMKSMVKQNYINIDTLPEPHTELNLDDDRNYMMNYYNLHPEDIIQLRYKVNINYCPFCGEKINIGDRVIGSPI